MVKRTSMASSSARAGSGPPSPFMGRWREAPVGLPFEAGRPLQWRAGGPTPPPRDRPRVVPPPFRLGRERGPAGRGAAPAATAKAGERAGAESAAAAPRGGAAAQPGHQLLLEQPLARLVEDAQLAWRAHEIGELVEEARAHAVERPDPRAVEDLRAEVGPSRRKLGGDPLPQLLRRTVAERDREDLVRRHSLLDEPAEPLRGRERLSCARAGPDEERPQPTSGSGRRLLAAENA